MLFLSTSIVQSDIILYRNGAFFYGFSRASIVHADDCVKISIKLSWPLKVEAGQYIDLWIPSVSFWSFLQSHPFVVTSWAYEKQSTLDLFVEPRKGLIRELLHYANANKEGRPVCSRLVLLSGPYGISAPRGQYGSFLVIATGFIMTASLADLKQLVHSYKARKIRTRRIHVIWQVQHIGKHKTG